MIIHLRSALEVRIPELKKTEKDTHFTSYVEASKRFQDSKIACLSVDGHIPSAYLQIIGLRRCCKYV